MKKVFCVIVVLCYVLIPATVVHSFSFGWIPFVGQFIDDRIDDIEDWLGKGGEALGKVVQASIDIVRKVPAAVYATVDAAVDVAVDVVDGTLDVLGESVKELGEFAGDVVKDVSVAIVKIKMAATDLAAVVVGDDLAPFLVDLALSYATGGADTFLVDQLQQYAVETVIKEANIGGILGNDVADLLVAYNSSGSDLDDFLYTNLAEEVTDIIGIDGLQIATALKNGDTEELTDMIVNEITKNITDAIGFDVTKLASTDLDDLLNEKLETALEDLNMDIEEFTNSLGNIDGITTYIEKHANDVIAEVVGLDLDTIGDEADITELVDRQIATLNGNVEDVQRLMAMTISQEQLDIVANFVMSHVTSEINTVLIDQVKQYAVETVIDEANIDNLLGSDVAASVSAYHDSGIDLAEFLYTKLAEEVTTKVMSIDGAQIVAALKEGNYKKLSDIVADGIIKEINDAINSDIRTLTSTDFENLLNDEIRMVIEDLNMDIEEFTNSLGNIDDINTYIEKQADAVVAPVVVGWDLNNSGDEVDLDLSPFLNRLLNRQLADALDIDEDAVQSLRAVSKEDFDIIGTGIKTAFDTDRIQAIQEGAEQEFKEYLKDSLQEAEAKAMEALEVAKQKLTDTR